MFSVVLTGTPRVHGSVHGLLSLDKLKTLSIFANSFSETPVSSPGIKGFTGLISISYNKINRVHGFTGPAHCEGGGGLPILLMLLLLILILPGSRTMPL